MIRIYKNEKLIATTEYEDEIFKIVYQDALKNYKNYEYEPLEVIEELEVEYTAYKKFYDVDEKDYRDMHNLRDFNTENAICILSNENKDKRESYDNAFINTTVVISKENINDIDKFWSKNSTLEMVFDFLVK